MPICLTDMFRPKTVNTILCVIPVNAEGLKEICGLTMNLLCINHHLALERIDWKCVYVVGSVRWKCCNW